MTQKKGSTLKNEKKLLMVAILSLLIFKIPASHSQEMVPVIATDVGADAIVGTPVEEIISAVENGGLTSNWDFSNLKPGLTPDAPEVLAATEEKSSDPEPMGGFDPGALEYLELQGGLSTSAQIDTENPTVFKLAAKFFERVVFKKDVEFENTPKFNEGMEISGVPIFDEDTGGYAVIKKGNQSVEVDFDKEYDAAPVVTATLSLEQYKDPEVRAVAADLLLISDVEYIISKVSKKGFEIMMDRKADSDIPFSWHALAVSKPKIHKKKGESSDQEILSRQDFDISGSPVENGASTNIASPNL